MAILAGIDEAGYGPLLGPLVVSGAAFRVPSNKLDTCLWSQLQESCTNVPDRAGRRLAIADSKVLYRSRASLAPLERAALVMLAVMGRRPATWRELLTVLAPQTDDSLEEYPWYAGRDVALPVSEEVGDLATRANAVKRDCHEQGLELLGVFSEPLLAGDFNNRVRNTRNKAVVLLGLVLRIVDRIVRAGDDEHVRVCVDRLGGRQHYREALATSMPGCDLRILEESSTRSAYRLIDTRRTYDIEFVTEGEKRHLPIALASVYSKYLRELFMHAFNDYWCGQLAGLKPTAGYYTDARRWLESALPALRAVSVDKRMLVRER